MNNEVFTVYRDGEVDPEFIEAQPTVIDVAMNRVREGINHFAGNIAIQTRMASFDVVHGTDYRHIRNKLMEQKKREEFERSIGLVAIDKR